MSRGRFQIPSDALPFTSPAYDLLTTATQLALPDNAHWKMGLQWQSMCPDADGTYGECTSPDGTPVPAPKADTWSRHTRGATPVTVYSRIDCAPVAEWDQLPEQNRQALLRAEAAELERIIWTGEAEQDSGNVTVFPHLADDGPTVIDGDDILQVAATVVTDIPQTIEVGIGMIEAAMRDCYHGVAMLHVPVRLAALMAEAVLLAPRAGVMYTSSVGSKVVLGEYPGTAPDGTSTDGVTWVYATGAVFFQREPTPHTFTPVESFDRDVNTLSMIAERTYVVGWDCCLLAIPILNGEDITS